mmetsp:Transcript_2020/g.5322  ORF Transcript_2020/g.5322 Transcript_2020/m.5322 type:complete len:222 (-) Transcript_2020:734-1399(-)
MNSEFQILRESFVKLAVGIFVFSQVTEHFNTLLHEILLDNTKNFVLLKSFTGNIERQIFRVNNTLDELEPFGHKFFAVVHDEYAPDIKFDFVEFFLCAAIEHIKRSSLGGEQNSLEFELTLYGKVLHSRIVFPIVRNRFVKRNVFVMGYFISLSHPDRFHAVQVFPFMANLLDFLRLLFLFGFFFVIYFFHLWLVIVTFIIIVVVVVIIVCDFLLGRLFGV